MLDLKKIAVTGGLACGKSSVCKIFRDLGAYVVSADAIVHQLLEEDGSPAQREIVEFLGEQVKTNGKLDRDKIAAVVFENPKCLRQLENILHPKVFEEINRHFQIAKEQKSPLFIAEIPLLFETKSEQEYDLSIAVVADQKKAEKRSALKGEIFQRRATLQLSNEEKAKRADIVINNNGTLADLRQESNKIFNFLVGAV
ncbi:MAG: dephospho-CoA kinase [Verrucomicrobia bacterium]|nr:dephospho-CoA kinase [Verrucomicrobiota bacterium]